MPQLREILEREPRVHFFIPAGTRWQGTIYARPHRDNSGEWRLGPLDFVAYAYQPFGPDKIAGDGSSAKPFTYAAPTQASPCFIVTNLWLICCQKPGSAVWLSVEGCRFRGTSDGVIADDGVLTRLCG